MEKFGRRIEDKDGISLYVRMKAVEDKLDENSKMLMDIKHCVLGTTSTIGLMERLRGLEGLAAQVRYAWVAILGVVLNAIREWWTK